MNKYAVKLWSNNVVPCDIIVGTKGKTIQNCWYALVDEKRINSYGLQNIITDGIFLYERPGYKDFVLYGEKDKLFNKILKIIKI